jgi:hypothetical protein
MSEAFAAQRFFELSVTMKINKTLLTFLGLYLIAVQLCAQLQQSARVEFLTADRSIEENFDVTPLNKSGLLVTHRKDEFYKAKVGRFIATIQHYTNAGEQTLR